MSAPAEEDLHTLAKVADRLDRVVELMERVLESTPKISTGTVQQVTVPTSVPAVPTPRYERMAWAMCLVTSIAFVVVVLQGQRISDIKADHIREIDELKREQAAQAAWAREESNIVRGYIWTGKVPVANPYPKQAEAQP